MLWGKMELSKRDKQMLLVEVLYSLGSYNRSKFQKILFLYFLPIFGIASLDNISFISGHGSTSPS